MESYGFLLRVCGPAHLTLVRPERPGPTALRQLRPRAGCPSGSLKVGASVEGGRGAGTQGGAGMLLHSVGA